MDIKVVNECTARSLEGKITFPEVVMKLAEAGIERYIVDLVGLKKLTFAANGENHTSLLNFISPRIAEKFDGAEVQNTIKTIQQGKIDYQTFLRRIMAAGCCHYEVFISGRKVIYFGRDGSFHIEPFPAAK